MLLNLFETHKTIICVGSGGVGKTTVAASLAVSAAMQGKKVLVLTIDPSLRLATALGLSTDTKGETKVPGQSFSGELFAGMIDAEAAFSDFLKDSIADKSKMRRISNNILYKQLSTTLSGSQEFTSLDRLYRASISGKYDLVILDTPPAQHAVDFLKAPEKIYALFQETVTQWFTKDKNQQSFVSKALHSGTRKVLSALEKVTGSEFIKALGDFFESLGDIKAQISSRSIDVHRLLTSSSTGFVLVTGFDEVKLREAESFKRDLLRGGYQLKAVVVNRAFPLWATDDKNSFNQDANQQKLTELYEKMSSFYQRRIESYENFQNKMIESGLEVVRIPEMTSSLSGLKGLEALVTYYGES